MGATGLPRESIAPMGRSYGIRSIQRFFPMAEITASLVKELRERTGAGMMECKKALTEANGDIDAAAEALRKSGLAKADKKAGRVAAEGRVAAAQADGKAALVEVNSETDFVAKDGNFIAFTDAVAKAALGAADVEALKSAGIDGQTVEEARAALIAKVGENVQVRRMARIDSANNLAAYVHGGRIGVLVEVKGGDAELARGLAMHIAAMNPPHVKASDVPADFIAKEKEIELAKMSEKDKAKPAEILEKIIGGKIAKIVNEVTLYGQPYVLDTDRNVEAVLKAAGAEVVGFQRLAVGEGIEKVVEDYAAEVMKQAGLA
jgi:elongation factor Ts